MKKIIYKSIFFLLLIGFAKQSEAQQDAMYTQYMFNTLAINPAYAGSRNVVSATALYRNQWTGYDGAPKTSTFSIDAPVNDKKIGLGLQIFNDRLGITNTTGLVLSSAYRIRMEKGTLSFGLQGSLNIRKADYTQVKLDPTGTSIDPAFQEFVKRTNFNIGSGIYYNSDKFYLGLSAPELLATLYGAQSSSGLSTQQIHLFLAAGFVASLSDDLKLKPSVLIKQVKGAPIEGDLNAVFWIKDILGIGGQYRTNADISGLLELQVTPQIRIGYSYDHSTTKLQSFNSGSHEIMLRYEFGFEKDKFISPRFF
ncbi:type IX secretion system membrane protein PorP/SprF [Pedobacter sp. SD-b]|uniref:Type IX secretion system membrane protein PorP/SprF n=1 Tax=Pedobacter segetis TaxID=2793069 RepID=A0ABS1BLF1_9SPHI|nr:type IX secretion system membrane protein PorP/SprF [Pedobacter segetis]MBK0383671.1 type IX secretion system membrane protein PorP/SprF [Pedobacter segetis]